MTSSTDQAKGAYTLRPGRNDEADFIFDVTRITMAEYAARSLKNWRRESMREFADDTAAKGSFEIIEADGERAGLLIVERHDSHIQLANLFIMPAFQNKGIGSHIIRMLIDESHAQTRPLKLRVFTSNPARMLYQRLGFAVTDQTEERYFMEYRPRQAS
ncbi:MAG: GNAT family N-acetyltransferase [Burkholderiales bacterium]|nr:GNAT family N-acetyltransferase [Burkholderiales bacterium]